MQKSFSFSFILFQLIGWQEVPRPNSRSEIVQAMRRIRVSINQFYLNKKNFYHEK